jgi:hypothetical protein
MFKRPLSARAYIFLITGIVMLMALVLLTMGREPICTCGYIKLWHGVVVSSENSQHLFDWYTFTHIIHGLGFYLLVFLISKLFGRRLPFGGALLIAVFLEGAWEILENTDMVINHYRAATISLDYYGDSVINSLGDVMAMIAGFWFAARRAVWQSILLFVGIELALAWAIRDNLTLNIIMLAHPIEAIKHWQAGG